VNARHSLVVERRAAAINFPPEKQRFVTWDWETLTDPARFGTRDHPE
jgi:hypothetical protein